MAAMTLTKENFEEEVRSAAPVVVDFWAPWCGYCRRIAPVVDQLAEEYAGKLTFAKINIDDHPELADQFQVETIPTLLLFRNGEASEPLIAPESQAQIREWLEDNDAL